MGQHLAAEEGFDAALFKERHLLGVTEVGVGLVFDDGGLAGDGGGEESAQRVGFDALPVDLLYDRRRGLGTLARVPERLYLLGGVGPFRVDALQPQGRSTVTFQ